MFPDLVDMHAFWASAQGRKAHHFILAVLRQFWPDMRGVSIAGIGYGIPFLEDWHSQAERTLAVVPAIWDKIVWPQRDNGCVAVVEPTMLPFADGSMDRILVVHALEYVELPKEFMTEIWRILAPHGRVIVVVPNRRGLWARFERTPFGHGQPYSRGQLRGLLHECLFAPECWGEALYFPPFSKPFLLGFAGMFERVAGRYGLPGAGAHIVEASKQVYRPVMVRKVIRHMPQMVPIMVSQRPML